MQRGGDPVTVSGKMVITSDNALENTAKKEGCRDGGMKSQFVTQKSLRSSTTVGQ